MTKRLKILFLEDNAADVVLIRHALTAGGLAHELTHVESRADFVRAFDRQELDVILSDHGVPLFDGLSALAMVRGRDPDIPFVFVSGAMGEQMTIATFERGATDYVLKNSLANLVPALRRALQAVEDRRRRRQAEADRERLIGELQAALAKVKVLHGLLPICAGCKSIREDDGYWKAIELYLLEHSAATFTHGLCPDCVTRFYPEQANEVALALPSGVMSFAAE